MPADVPEAGVAVESADHPDPLGLLFEALITPHRSLDRRGSLILMASVLGASALIAARFWLVGAWPVVAFSLVEAPLAVLLLVVNRQRARSRELIQLRAAEITVVQTDHRGRRRSFSLPSAWLQVRLETADNRTPRLLLSSHGLGREVGAFLHETEKRSLFEALRDALARLRQPRFDNKQLREQ